MNKDYLHEQAMAAGVRSRIPSGWDGTMFSTRYDGWAFVRDEDGAPFWASARDATRITFEPITVEVSDSVRRSAAARAVIKHPDIALAASELQRRYYQETVKDASICVRAATIHLRDQPGTGLDDASRLVLYDGQISFRGRREPPFNPPPVTVRE